MTTSRKCPEELRERAVRLYFESGGRPIAHVARDLGIHREALRQWVRKGEADAAPPTSNHVIRPGDAVLVVDDWAETGSKALGAGALSWRSAAGATSACRCL